MFTVAALYHFAALPDAPARREALLEFCAARGIIGTLILAQEGINGTVAAPEREAILDLIAHLHGWPGFEGLDWKESAAEAAPFRRLKVRLKREIVTMGQPGVDPRGHVGTHVAPAEWNALISAPDVVTIDTRNGYEVAVGSFEGAVDPGTTSFREFPDWWAANADKLAGKRIAMFCTGGIRCEKSTSFLKAQGIDEVYHLKGGVLKYLEEVPQEQSLWRGECFVFDERVAVGHGLEPGSHVLCRACRMPVSPEAMGDPAYVEGISCPGCIEARSDEDRARYAERQRQMGG
ncbi:rhodanese-related sulfurtransferase [Limimaricola variabilis]|uniref:oxygen-dependent tRNA uridine(34) hydroxylase TrhO n=1 Tax=Limimaricola variabilis TaxID=1492771 RepID=UPI002AC92602|nr:rhodanese-related sulfurtransferase [Limimaricola variabilis]WPY93787.1 rhodanese-related sulfurtransferase [Limimaricola variabilis]